MVPGDEVDDGNLVGSFAAMNEVNVESQPVHGDGFGQGLEQRSSKLFLLMSLTLRQSKLECLIYQSVTPNSTQLTIYKGFQKGDTTFSTPTLSLTTLSIMALSTAGQNSNMVNMFCQFPVCHDAECRYVVMSLCFV